MAEASVHSSYGSEKELLMPEIRAKYGSTSNALKIVHKHTGRVEYRENHHPSEWTAAVQHALYNPMDFTVVFAERSNANLNFEEAFTESELKAMSIKKLAVIYKELGGADRISSKADYMDGIIRLQKERDENANLDPLPEVETE